MEEQTTAQAGPALVAPPAILRATIQIKRAATGKVEEYEITGYQADPAPPKEQQE